MIARLLLFAAFALVLLSAPATATAADVSAQVPEGSSLTLFALGLAGLIIGRRAAISKKRDSDDD